MSEATTVRWLPGAASHVLGRKLDSIPFSGYHVLIIAVLGLVGFIEGYDLVMTGSLLVLAKAPLHLTEADNRWLLFGPPATLTLSGFAFSAVGDRLSRKAIMLIGVTATTFFTLLIPLVQNAEQLVILRLLTGLGAGGVVSAPFPIASELMPAQHRRTYSAVYEMSLASSFTVVPFIAGLLAGNINAFRFLALPGGLAVTVIPVIVYFALPGSPRWHLRGGRPQVAVDIVNRIIARCGNRVPPLTLAELGDTTPAAREQLPPYWALFARGQIRWTAVGVFSGVFAGTAFFLISTLLPKAMVDQGMGVSLGFGLTSLVYVASIFGKGFTGFLMEIIGRRWTIFYALAGSLPGLFLMLIAHRAGGYATVVIVAGGLITGFTVLSAFTATRMYLSEQFPTALRGRGQIFGESFGRLFANGLVPALIVPHTGSPTIFFGSILAVVAIGAFVPVLFGRETIGQLETVTESAAAVA
ncbi:MAG: MFS transporter [Alphaproteobacteria bacterium]|nr:MFS transporter [Alphaproteobacteria bacterium]